MSGVLALGILALGTVFHEKNADIFSQLTPKLNEASVVSESSDSVPASVGNCQQNSNLGFLSTLQPEISLFATVNNFDDILTGTATFDTAAMSALTAAVASDRIAAKIVQSGAKYQFIVKDGQVEFWKCVLKKNKLFSEVTESQAAKTVEFFSETGTFKKQINNFGYNISESKYVEQFLNFVKLPGGHQILETTVLNPEGEIFFKVFEVELDEEQVTYNDLRQDLRSRVGVTNLRPAVFGADSYYWMWGENDKMAASVFFLQGKVFGISYHTVHFKHIRRVIDGLLEEIRLLVKKVELVKKKESRFADLKLTEFEQLSDTDLGVSLVRALDQLENADGILGEKLSGNILEATEPIEIPEAVEVSDEEIPINLK